MSSKSLELTKLQRLTDLHLVYWEMEPSAMGMKIEPYLDEVVNHPLSKMQTFSEFMIFLHESQREDFETNNTILIQNKKPLDIKLPIRQQKKWIRIVAEYDQASNLYAGYILDISKEADKDRVYRNLNLELSAFEKGLEQFSIVARTDPMGKITFANEEFCRLSKYTEEELLGQDHRIVNSGHHPKEFFKGMWDNIKKGVSWRGTVKNKAKDGTFYWVDTIVIPIHNTYGQLTEILSFRFDVTLLQQAKAENHKLKEELKKVSA